MPTKVNNSKKPKYKRTKKEEEDVDINAVVKSLILDRIKEEITHPGSTDMTQYVRDDPLRTYTKADPRVVEEE